MNQMAQAQHIPQPVLEYGTVAHCGNDNRYRIETAFGAVTADRAVGCLVTPRTGDTVLLSTDESDAAYVLSVLKRPPGNDRETVLEVAGNLQLMSRGGSVHIAADDAVGISGNTAVEVTTERLSVTATSGEAILEKVSVMGRMVYIQAKRILSVAKSVEQQFRHLTQRLKNTERYVEEHEEIQTESTRYLVKDALTTHAGNTLNISEELHTMQAEQIHMG